MNLIVSKSFQICSIALITLSFSVTCFGLLDLCRECWLAGRVQEYINHSGKCRVRLRWVQSPQLELWSAVTFSEPENCRLLWSVYLYNGVVGVHSLCSKSPFSVALYFLLTNTFFSFLKKNPKSCVLFMTALAIKQGPFAYFLKNVL